MPKPGLSTSEGEPIICWIENVSSTGMCIRTLTMLNESRMVRCDIPVGETPVSIPTLAQVRWSLVDDKLITYRAGLHFII